MIKLITNFYQKMFRIKPKIGITGLNPHCESNFNQSEEDKIIIPAIKYLSKKKFKSLKYSAPPLEEQQEIALKLDMLFDYLALLEDNHRHDIESLVELKQSILQEAFSAELTGGITA